MDEHNISSAASLLSKANRILAFVGSGLSQESGIPTFRGDNGLYDDPEVASYTKAPTFRKKPKKVLSWYQKRRDMLGEVEPNAGHLALPGIAASADYFGVATQNVDDLLERAFEGAQLEPDFWHLHGELALVKCSSCDYAVRDRTLDLSSMPNCERCSSLLRPGVVWFGEALPQQAFQEAKHAADRAYVCLVLGTSGMVYPAAHIPEAAKKAGADLIEVNPNETELSRQCDICLRAKTGEALPELERRLSQ
jgi:NAD-dependent deacetylase